ncbi:MAG: hypothetical protein AB7L92_06275 [Alphaproteobacteria bacterium]
MVDIRAIQNLGYEHPDTGIPDEVKNRIDDAVASGLNKAWRGMLQVAASGFGKGVLIAAAITLAAGMIIGGADATISGALVEAGVKEGFLHAVNFLTHGAGLLTLAVGGAIGAVADARSHQGRITEQMAKDEAARLEIARARGNQQMQERESEIRKHTTPPAVEYARTESIERKFKEPTNGRAAKSVASAVNIGEVNLDPVASSYAQREKERRLARQAISKAF